MKKTYTKQRESEQESQLNSDEIQIDSTESENQHNEEAALINRSPILPSSNTSVTSPPSPRARNVTQPSKYQQYSNSQQQFANPQHVSFRQPQQLLLFGFPCLSLPPMVPLRSANDLESWKSSAKNYFAIHNVDSLVEKSVTESYKQAQSMNNMIGFLSDDMLRMVYKQRCRQLTATIAESLKALAGIEDIRRSFVVKYAGLENEQQNQLIQADVNPYFLWSYVNASSGDTSFLSWNNLYRNLTTLKYCHGDSPSILFGKLESIRSKINECKSLSFPSPGNKLPEELYAIQALNSLPDTEDYQTIRNLIVHTTDTKNVITKLREALQIKYDETINEKGIRKQQQEEEKARALRQDSKRIDKSNGDKVASSFKGKKGKLVKKVISSDDDSTENETDGSEDEEYHEISKVRALRKVADKVASPIRSVEQTCPLISSSNESFSCILDSAASRHIFCTTSLVTKQTQLDKPLSVQCASGHFLPLTHEGTVLLSNRVILNNVAVAKNASVNIISATQLVKSGFRIILGKENAKIYYRKTGKQLPIVFNFDDEKLEYSYQIQSKHVDKLKSRNSINSANRITTNCKPKLPTKPEDINLSRTEQQKQRIASKIEHKVACSNIGDKVASSNKASSASKVSYVQTIEDKVASSNDEIDQYIENLFRISEFFDEQQIEDKVASSIINNSTQTTGHKVACSDNDKHKVACLSEAQHISWLASTPPNYNRDIRYGHKVACSFIAETIQPITGCEPMRHIQSIEDKVVSSIILTEHKAACSD